MTCPRYEELVELAIATTQAESLPPALRTTNKHVKQCLPCGRLLHDYVTTVNGIKHIARLDSILERTPECLDDNLLAGYVDGTLEQKGRECVENHVPICEYCLEQLVELSELVVAMPREYSPLSYAIDITKAGLELLKHPNMGFTRLEAQPVAVLGPPTNEKNAPVRKCEWTQTQGEFCIHFSVTQTDKDLLNLDLVVTKQTNPPTGTRLNLRHGGKLLQSESLSKSGTVTIHDLTPEVYEGEVNTPTDDTVSFTLHLRRS